jgi:hypothetical protein
MDRSPASTKEKQIPYLPDASWRPSWPTVVQRHQYPGYTNLNAKNSSALRQHLLTKGRKLAALAALRLTNRSGWSFGRLRKMPRALSSLSFCHTCKPPRGTMADGHGEIQYRACTVRFEGRRCYLAALVAQYSLLCFERMPLFWLQAMSLKGRAMYSRWLESATCVGLWMGCFWRRLWEFGEKGWLEQEFWDHLIGMEVSMYEPCLLHDRKMAADCYFWNMWISSNVQYYMTHLGALFLMAKSECVRDARQTLWRSRIPSWSVCSMRH